MGGVGMRHYLLPHAKRIADEGDRLKERLGREPTDDELARPFRLRLHQLPPANLRIFTQREAGGGWS